MGSALPKNNHPAGLLNDMQCGIARDKFEWLPDADRNVLEHFGNSVAHAWPHLARSTQRLLVHHTYNVGDSSDSDFSDHDKSEHKSADNHPRPPEISEVGKYATAMVRLASMPNTEQTPVYDRHFADVKSGTKTHADGSTEHFPMNLHQVRIRGHPIAMMMDLMSPDNHSSWICMLDEIIDQYYRE